MNKTPRDYQLNAFDSILFGWDFYQRQLLRLATGAGKTIVYALLIKSLYPKRCLYLADQDELCDQPMEVIQEWAGILPQVEKASKRASLGAKVIVGSAQTLSRQNRLTRFPPDFFDYIFVDEAHRGAKRDKKVCDYFANAKVVGCTATPFNARLRDLSKFYEHIAFNLPMLDLMNLGYAPPLDIVTLPVEIDLEHVEKDSTGEYEAESLSTTIEPWYDEIAKLLSIHAADRHTIAFLPLIKSSQAFAEICQRHGINAKHVDGQSEDRTRTLRDFKDGKIQLLCNAQVVETGVDLPIADCFVHLRPCRSPAKYQQGLGRCTRPLPGVIDGLDDPADRALAIAMSAKPNTLVIDFLWQHDKLGVMHAGHLFASNEEEAEAIRAETAKVRTPEELAEIAARVLAQRENDLVKKLEAANRKSTSKLIDPQLFAHLINDRRLLNYDPKEDWESKPPSDKQVECLRRWGVDFSKVESRGFASKLMDACIWIFQNKLATPQLLRELNELHCEIPPGLTRNDAIAMAHSARHRKMKEKADA